MFSKKPKIECLKVKPIHGILENVAINNSCVNLTSRRRSVIFSLEMPSLSSITSSANGIYLSIQSKIGCHIRVVVQSGESRNERKDSVQVEQKKTIDDLYEECDPEEIHNELTDYLEVNYKSYWDFDAIDRHKRRL